MIIVVPTHVDDGPRRTDVPIANALIIAANVLLYFLGARWVVGPGTDVFSVVGYGFSHAGLGHLIVNMWTLLVIGTAVNRRLGDAYYVLCYFGTVVTLGLFARLFAGQYLIGSSGAVFAVIAVMALLLPGVWASLGYVAVFPLTVLIGLFARPDHWLYWLIRWGTFRLRAWWLLFLVPVLQIFGLFWWWGNWTNLGHLLGFFCGVAFVTLLPAKVSMPGRAAYGVS